MAYDAFEAIGPTEAEKEQLLDALLKVKTRRHINLRPVAILAASIALIAVVASPFARDWFRRIYRR